MAVRSKAQVLDPAGAPVADALIRIGKGKMTGLTAGLDGAQPACRPVVRSDAEGRFRAIGIPAGTQPVQAARRGPGSVAGQLRGGRQPRTCPCASTSAAAPTMRGVVTGPDGPLGKTDIQIGKWGDLAHYRARSAADGTFEFTGLPAAELVVSARHDEHGKASETVQTSVHTAVECVLQVGRGLELHGTVTDAQGKAIENASIESHSSGNSTWFNFARTGKDGRFSIPNCPEKGSLTLRVRAKGFESTQRTVPDARSAGEVEFRLQPKAAGQRAHHRQGARARRRATGKRHGPGGPEGRRHRHRIDANGTRTATSNSDRWSRGRCCSRFAPKGCHRFGASFQQVDAGSTWNVGTVRMAASGHVRLTARGAPEGTRFYVYDANWRLAARFDERDGALVSDPLAAGEYRLMVSGKQTAAQAKKLTVRVDEVKPLEVEVRAGVAQRFECDTSRLPPPVKGLRLVVMLQGEPVARTWLAGGKTSAASEALPHTGRLHPARLRGTNDASRTCPSASATSPESPVQVPAR